jgi:metal-responsive CopG/Arc/MetJ family transcriptional regulator
MSDDLINEIDGRLDYGDSRAAWIREACRQRLEREGEQ